MAASNIEKFDEYTALIFARLYGSFPLRIDLSHVDFLYEEWSREPYDHDVYNPQAEFLTATMQWLKDAGYLSGEPSAIGLYKAVLTAKGLEVLKATPASLEHGPSIGERISDAVKAEGRETMRGLVSEALGIGARLISPLVGLSS